MSKFNNSYKQPKHTKPSENNSSSGLVTSQRDFNSRYKYRPETKHAHYKNPPISSIFANLASLINKFKVKSSYLSAIAIITITLIWLFSGKHNNQLITQDIDLRLGIESSTQNNLIDSLENNQEQKIIEKIEQENTPKQIITTQQKQDNTDNITTKIITIRKNDNLSNIFNKFNIDNNDFKQIITDKNINKQLRSIQAGQKLKISYYNQSKKIKEITYFLDKFNLYVIERAPEDQDKLIAQIKKLDVDEQTSFAKFTINSSLFEDAQKQRLSNNLIFQIIDIFTWDIDFAQDLRTGDTVELLYKEYYNKGEPYATGPILAIRFINNGKEYSAVRYEKNGYSDYYTPDGLTLRKAFIRTPVKFTRISSKFSLGRNHPLLHKIRAHRGVDYAAPTGTPIKAAGDGKIIHYGRKGGYGKAAVIQHGQKYTTLYAHMSRYNSKLRRGSQVKQGEIIGYVGSTGLATGPHLHYEFRVNGEHKNPLTVPLPKAKPIDTKHKIKFIDHANIQMATLDKYSVNTDNLLASNKVNFE